MERMVYRSRSYSSKVVVTARCEPTSSGLYSLQVPEADVSLTLSSVGLVLIFDVEDADNADKVDDGVSSPVVRVWEDSESS